MVKRYIILACFVISSVASALACTSAIIGAEANPYGRPLLWKNRDTSTIDNKVEYVPGSDGHHSYVALFNSNDKKLEQAWMGMNDAGFAVMNTAVNEIISLGDTVTFDVKCRELLNGRVTGGAFDDRSGIVSILYALELLKDKKTAYNVTVIFSAQEELGERGAKIGAFEINPDIALAVDVSFA